MDNAAKALLIAGGVFLAIMVVSIGIYMYGTFNKSASSYVTRLDAVELQKYNNPYEILINRKDISAQEIISVVGDSQQKNGKIKVTVYDTDDSILFEGMQDADSEKLSEFLNSNILYSEESSNKLAYFSCNELTYDTDGKVTSISFKKAGDKNTIVNTPENTNPTHSDDVHYVDPSNPETIDSEKPSTGTEPEWTYMTEPEDVNGNQRPRFLAGTDIHKAYVKDPDGDNVYMKSTVEVIVFPSTLREVPTSYDYIGSWYEDIFLIPCKKDLIGNTSSSSSVYGKKEEKPETYFLSNYGTYKDEIKQLARTAKDSPETLNWDDTIDATNAQKNTLASAKYYLRWGIPEYATYKEYQYEIRPLDTTFDIQREITDYTNDGCGGKKPVYTTTGYTYKALKIENSATTWRDDYSKEPYVQPQAIFLQNNYVVRVRYYARDVHMSATDWETYDIYYSNFYCPGGLVDTRETVEKEVEDGTTRKKIYEDVPAPTYIYSGATDGGKCPYCSRNDPHEHNDLTTKEWTGRYEEVPNYKKIRVANDHYGQLFCNCIHGHGAGPHYYWE